VISYPCHRFTSLRKKKFKLGNILDGGVKRLADKKFQRLAIKAKYGLPYHGCLALNYECHEYLGKPLVNYQKFKNIYLDLITMMHAKKEYRGFLKHLKSLYHKDLMNFPAPRAQGKASFISLSYPIIIDFYIWGKFLLHS